MVEPTPVAVAADSEKVEAVTSQLVDELANGVDVVISAEMDVDDVSTTQEAPVEEPHGQKRERDEQMQREAAEEEHRARAEDRAEPEPAEPDSISMLVAGECGCTEAQNGRRRRYVQAYVW